MLAAVVPAKNEAPFIARVLQNLLAVPVDLIIPVVNGSNDRTPEIVRRFASPRVQPLFFSAPLGIDVPRAVGAARALAAGATAVLFVDGDMAGNILGALRELARTVEKGGADLALTNCYPPAELAFASGLVRLLLEVRLALNRELGLAGLIGTASPSHGPHAVSRRFLERVPLAELAVPPVALALAARQGLKIRVGACLAHRELGSPFRHAAHARLVAETIIGDCLEALCVARGLPRRRELSGVSYPGYHPQRNLSVLSPP